MWRCGTAYSGVYIEVRYVPLSMGYVWDTPDTTAFDNLQMA